MLFNEFGLTMDWYTYFSDLEKTCAVKESKQAVHHHKRISSKRIGELLIEWGIITTVQLKKALDIQKNLEQQANTACRPLSGEILVELGIASDQDIIKAFSVQYHLPYFPASRYRINGEALGLIPEKTARRLNLIPLDKFGRCLTVAMSNPLNTQAIEEIENLTDCTIQSVCCHSSDINQAIDNAYQRSLI